MTINDTDIPYIHMPKRILKYCMESTFQQKAKTYQIFMKISAAEISREEIAPRMRLSATEIRRFIGTAGKI